MSFLFIPCGTMFPRNLSVAGDVAASHASDPSTNLWSRGPESTRSSINARAKKRRNKLIWWRAYLMTRGGTRNVGSSSRFDHGFIGRWFIRWSSSSSWSSLIGWLAVDPPLNLGHWIGGSRSSTQLNLHRTAEKIRGRTPRSRSDRTAIAVRSSRDHGSFVMESPPRSLDGVHWWIEITINSRSWLFWS